MPHGKEMDEMLQRINRARCRGFACAVAAVACVSTAPVGSAAVILSEGFESYAVGELGTQGGWTSSSAANTEIVNTTAAPLVANGLNGGTRAFEITGNADPLANRSIGPVTGTVYISALWQYVGGTLNDADQAFMRLTGTGFSAIPEFGIRVNTIGTSDLIARIGVNTSGATVVGSTDIVAGETYQLVARLSKSGANAGNYDQFTFWVNPVDESSTAVGTATGNTGGNTVTGMSIRGVNLDASPLDVIRIDEIRIGDTFADVVPEPSSVALGALSAVWLLGRRRRGLLS
jgi:hypothetical protein